MSAKSSRPSMKQSTLSFSSSKPTAVANKSAKTAGSATESPATSRSSSTKTKKRKPVETVDSDDSSEEEIDVDDIHLAPDSDDEAEEEKKDEDVKPEGDLRKVVPTAEVKTAGGKVKNSRTAKTAVTPAAAVPDGSWETKEKTEKEKKEEDEKRPSLDINNPAYNKLSRDYKAINDFAKPVHNDDADRVEDILRVFDFNYDYGPCVGITRLERWERAQKLGLNPPAEIYDILTTKEGVRDTKYRENVLHGRV